MLHPEDMPFKAFSSRLTFKTDDGQLYIFIDLNVSVMVI